MHTIIEHSRRDMLYARVHRARARRIAALFAAATGVVLAIALMAATGLVLATALGVATQPPDELTRPAVASSE